MKEKLILFVAQGFGVGRIPFAPGTFGSVVGLGWFALLLATGNIWLFALGTVLGLAASVWFCGKAEKILGQTDPGSVVLDEIAAMPVCFWVFVPAVFVFCSATNCTMPKIESFFFAYRLEEIWPLAAMFLVTFRIFDIWKPWPIRQSQRLPGGWGVTIDDVLAAICAGIVSTIVFYVLMLWMVS